MATFTAPDGTKYNFNGTPTQEDLDNIIAYHSSVKGQKPSEKPAQPKEDSIIPQFLKDAFGGIEAAAGIVSGVPSFVAGGVEGLVRAPFQGIDKAVEEMRKTQDYRYHPKTDSGKLAEEGFGKLFEKGIEKGTPIAQNLISDLPISENAKQSIASGVTEGMLMNMPLTGMARPKGKAKLDPALEKELADRTARKQAEKTGEQLELPVDGANNKFGVDPRRLEVDENGMPFLRQESLDAQTMARQGDLFEGGELPQPVREPVKPAPEAPLPDLQNALSEAGLIPDYVPATPKVDPLTPVIERPVDVPDVPKAGKEKIETRKDVVPEEDYVPLFLDDIVESVPAKEKVLDKFKGKENRPADPLLTDWVKQEEGLPFSIEDIRSNRVRMAEQSRDVQAARKEVERTQQRVNEIDWELKNKTELGPEKRMQLQDTLNELQRDLREQTEAMRRIEEATTPKVKPQGEGAKVPVKTENVMDAFQKGTKGKKTSWPIEKTRDARSVFGKNQRGTIDPSVFADGFKKVKELVGGIRLVASSEKMGDPRFDMLRVQAVDSSGKRVGEVVFAKEDINALPKDTNLVATDVPGVYVSPSMQRKGLASDMYKFASELGNDIVSSSHQTPEGRSMWEGFQKKGISQEGKIFGKSQQGSWTPFAKKEKPLTEKYKSLDEFLAAVPEQYREAAVEMWKEAGGRAQIQSQSTKAIAGMPGVREDLKYMIDPENLKYDDARGKLVGTPDIKAGDIRNNVMSAGQMMSQFFKNDLMTWSIGMIKSFAEQSRKSIRDTEKLVIEAVHELKKVEGEQALINVMDALAKGQKPENLGPKAKALYDKINGANDKIYQMLNEEYKQLTGKDLTKRENYFTHSWSGPWGFEVYALNEKGQRVLVDVIREKTRGQANQAREWASKIEGVEIGEVNYNSKFEANRNTMDSGFFDESIAQLIDMSGQTSPKAREAQKAFRDHFKHQTGVGGYLGNKPWKSAKENMADALDSFYNYVNASNQWAHGQKAKRELNKFINDDKINAPNAKALAQQYYNNSFSRNKQLIELQDSLAESFAKFTGISKSSIGSAVRNNKAFMTMLTLSWNPRFLMTQMMQPLQTVIPKLLEISQVSGKRASHSLNFTVGMLDGMSKGKLTKDGEMLWKYAEDNHIIDPRVIEHIEGFSTMNKGKYWTEQVLTVPNKWAEKVTRFWAFSSLYRTARELGLSEKDSLNLAKNQTQTSMVSYELADRPIMYGKLGNLGEAASNLQTYKHNNYTALVDYYKLGKNQGKWQPFVAQMGMQLAVAGAIGMYTIQELEAIWEGIKWADNKISGGKNTKDIPSITEMLINHAPDYVTFGGLSAATGLDLQASFSAGGIIPESASQAAFPLVNKEMQMIQSGLTALKSWDNKEDWGVFLDKSMPATVRGHVAERMLTHTKPDGSTVKIKASLDPARRIAEVENPTDAYFTAKKFGTQPLEITKKNRLMFEDVKSEGNLRDIQDSLSNKILKEVSKGVGNVDKEAVGKAYRQYVEAGGDEERLKAAIEKIAKQRGTADPRGQLLTGGESTAAQLRDKRILDRFKNVQTNR